MARLFNLEVFNQTIAGAAEDWPVYRSGAESYATLGSADILVAQIIVESVTALPATVTVSYELSNTTEEETWIINTGIEKAVEVTTEDELPAKAYLRVMMSDFVLPAYGRFAVSASVASATVRVIVCGRTN